MGTYAQTKAWRKKNPKKRSLQRARNYQKTEKNGYRKGEIWLTREDKKITSPKKPTDRVLSKLLGRTVKGIQKRRYKLKYGLVGKK